MTQFRKKPVVIEAMQWDGTRESYEDIARWSNLAVQWSVSASALLINTLEGTLAASRSDWIIRGVKGEFYPCKPDIFEATYDPIGGTE